ncbi:MAG: glycosyl transferase family 1, partial [Muribaculaceae bacterium]
MGKRILLVNKFYYNRGGDCVCTINLETLLKSKGHKVMVYAMDYSQNNATEDATYFASNVDFTGGIVKKINAIKRIFGFGDVVSSFKNVLEEFKPDVVHIQNIHS